MAEENRSQPTTPALAPDTDDSPWEVLWLALPVFGILFAWRWRTAQLRAA